MAGASGKKLDETYKLAWLRGLKTTYYLRTLAATQAEKSTVTAGQMNAVSNGSVAAAAVMQRASSTIDPALTLSSVEPASDMKFCAISDPDCEACQ